MCICIIFQNFITKEVIEHIDSYHSSDIRDIIDMYLTEAERLEEEKEKANEDRTKPYLNKDDIWMCVFDLFLAGTETTSTALLWFLLVMAAKPDIQEKVKSPPRFYLYILLFHAIYITRLKPKPPKRYICCRPFS